MKNKIIRICLILMLMLTLCINTTYVLAEDEESSTVSTEKEPEPTVEPTEEPTDDYVEEPDQTGGTISKPSNKPITTTTPKPSSTPQLPEDNSDNESDQEEDNSQSTVSGNIILNTVVKNVTEKEDFSGKGVSSIKIKGINKNGEKKDYELTPKFDINTYDYKCRVDLDIENIEINMELIDEEWSAEVIGNNKIVEGENLITIISRNEDKTENVTYQINITKADEVIENTPDATLKTNNQETKKNAKKDIILIVCLAIIIVSVSVIVVTKVLKYRKQQKIRGNDKDEM